MMVKRRYLALKIAFPLFFFLVISSYNFFHTEKTPFEDQKCPACNFQHSIQGIELIILAEPPAPIQTYLIEPTTTYHFTSNFINFSNLRAPPLNKINYTQS